MVDSDDYVGVDGKLDVAGMVEDLKVWLSGPTRDTRRSERRDDSRVPSRRRKQTDG